MTQRTRVRPPLNIALVNALRLRCPRCRKGRVFRGWPNRVLPRCPVCGLSYFRESGYYLGGMILTYIFTALVIVIVYLISLFLPAPKHLAPGSELALWISFAILLTLLFVRPAYSLWLSLDFWIAPWEPNS